MSKPEARSYSAASNSRKDAGPLAFGDKCFLCSGIIGESDPRGFYTANNSMMLAHRGCLDALDAAGGDPKKLYEMRAAADKKAQEQQAPAEQVSINTPGVSNVKFATFGDMQEFIAARGPIPANVGVFIGDQKFQ
jgi:hypothetical protein